MNEQTTDEVKRAYRAATEDDLALIFNSWLKELYWAPSMRFVDEPDFVRQYHKVIEAILHRAHTLILCNECSPQHIFGYVVFERPNVCHWIYIKSLYRAHGWGKELLRRALPSASPIVCTHATNLFKSDTTVQHYNLIYSPFSLYTQAKDHQ